MGILGDGIAELITGTAKGVAKVAVKAAGAAGQGLQDVTDLVKETVSDYFAAPPIDKTQRIEQQKLAQEARRLGVTIDELRKLTPEKKQQLEKMYELKLAIDERITELDTEIAKLRASYFRALFTRKIVGKQIKRDELHTLRNMCGLDSFRRRADEALREKPDVTSGLRRSKTKALLKRIIDELPAEAVNASHLSIGANT